jgi:hypothetical protein
MISRNTPSSLGCVTIAALLHLWPRKRVQSAVAPSGARWQPAPVAMNSITPMPTTVRSAQVLVDYESDELDLSDRTMCAFAIMLRAVPVMTVDCSTLLCIVTIVHCLGRTFARIVMGIGPIGVVPS